MNAHLRARRGFTWIRLASAIACLVVTGPALAAQLALTWTDNATNEDGFAIERRLNPSGTYSEIATVGANVTTYTDTTVTAGQAYCYRGAPRSQQPPWSRLCSAHSAGRP